MALTTNLVSYWKLDESSGNAADAVGSNTLVNTGVTYVSGKIGNAADFERGDSTDALSISDASQSGLDFSASFSISAWVNLESKPSNIGVIVSKWNPSAASDLSYRFSVGYDDSRLYLETSSTGSNELVSYCSWNPSTATWYHVVVTYDGGASAGSRVKLYIDGSAQSMALDDAPATLPNSSQDFNVGNNGTNRQFDGIIDEVGVWSRVLTSDDVTALYNSGAGSQYPFNATYTIAAALGTFAITGVDVAFRKTLSVAAELGTFALTGIDVVLSRGYLALASVGSFVLTGLDASFSKGITVAADVGSFALTGVAATFSRGLTFSLGVGSFILTGMSVRFSIFWRTLNKNVVSVANAARNVVSWVNQDKTNS